jgi:hypothetical protein
MQLTSSRRIPICAIVFFALLLVIAVYTNDPIGGRVATYDAQLLESGPPGKWRTGTTLLRVQLPSGATVMASAPDALRSAPPGTKVAVVQYSTLLFKHPAYVVQSAGSGH